MFYVVSVNVQLPTRVLFRPCVSVGFAWGSNYGTRVDFLSLYETLVLPLSLSSTEEGFELLRSGEKTLYSSHPFISGNQPKAVATDYRNSDKLLFLLEEC